MTPRFYDTHAHLDYPDYADDLPLVLGRAHAAGVTRIITIGTDLASSVRAIRLSEQYSGLYATVGWHPQDALKAPDDLRPALHALAVHPKVVAIGEIGLDYYRLPGAAANGNDPADDLIKQRQNELFRQQLEVAAELGLNCVIHQRAAWADTLAVFRPFAARVRAVFHCFVDELAIARQVLALGSLVSFTGIVTFKNAQKVRDTLAALEPDQFMLETDCPFLAPVPYRGKRCEPGHVREIAQAVARIKGCSLEDLGTATCDTAARFFFSRCRDQV
jgi:TatD DNase family protein